MTEAALEIRGLTFRYRPEGEPVLSAVDLAAAAGQVHWVTGPLGAGCTTLMMAAAGLAPRYTGGTLAGSVRLLGLDVEATDAPGALAGRVAFVTAVPSVQLSGIATTVREEVAFAPANLGWPRARIGAAVDDALARLGAAHLAERDPATLSGGETQRVVLAAMLALRPDAWFLDEAGSALDAAGRALLGELVRSESRRGALVVVASEDADSWAPVADRLIVLGGGRIVADAAPAVLLAGQTAWDLGVGSTGTAELARIAHALAPGPRLEPPYPLTVAEGVARWR